jgi:hypothetical protein
MKNEACDYHKDLNFIFGKGMIIKEMFCWQEGGNKSCETVSLPRRSALLHPPPGVLQVLLSPRLPVQHGGDVHPLLPANHHQ